MAMTATVHISRRTTPHHPFTGLRQRWGAFHLRHFRRVQSAYFEAVRERYPLSDEQEYRHALDAPSVEDAFARLAADHADRVTPADGGATARDNDREVLLLATCDAWFRDIHGPQYRWSPRTISAYERLQSGVRSCFHPGGEA